MKTIFAIFFAFSSGMVISGAVFAFIAGIGLVPLMAQKTKTAKQIRLYEEAIMFGGIAGTIVTFSKINFEISKVYGVVFGFTTGVFFGALAMSLAEVLDVIPILARRGKFSKVLYFFILAIALGKFIGSLLYFCVDGFYSVS